MNDTDMTLKKMKSKDVEEWQEGYGSYRCRDNVSFRYDCVKCLTRETKRG